MNIQLKRGVLEICVLSILSVRDCYGYELVSEVSKAVTISEGTIYPLMSRLRNEKLVDTYLKESSEGPPRKYYKLTDHGKRVQIELKNEWLAFSKAVNQLITRSERYEYE